MFFEILWDTDGSKILTWKPTGPPLCQIWATYAIQLLILVSAIPYFRCHKVDSWPLDLGAHGSNIAERIKDIWNFRKWITKTYVPWRDCQVHWPFHSWSWLCVWLVSLPCICSSYVPSRLSFTSTSTLLYSAIDAGNIEVGASSTARVNGELRPICWRLRPVFSRPGSMSGRPERKTRRYTNYIHLYFFHNFKIN